MTRLMIIFALLAFLFIIFFPEQTKRGVDAINFYTLKKMVQSYTEKKPSQTIEVEIKTVTPTP